MVFPTGTLGMVGFLAVVDCRSPHLGETIPQQHSDMVRKGEAGFGFGSEAGSVRFPYPNLMLVPNAFETCDMAHTAHASALSASNF